MEIQMTGHNIKITEQLREFTEKKLKHLKAYEDMITNTHITFNVDKLTQIAEAQINVPGNTIHARADSEKMYTAVDALMNKLVRQLKKYKEKHSDHR